MRFPLEPDGTLAQVVEQLAFNQRVAGSSPARLTLNSISYDWRHIAEMSDSVKNPTAVILTKKATFTSSCLRPMLR